MDELLLYIRLEDDVTIDDGVARTIGAADRHMLVAWIRDAVAQRLVERWASADEPVDLTGPMTGLENRAVGIRLTDAGRAKVDALLDHQAAQSDELDEATRRALDQPRVAVRASPRW